MIGIQVCNFKDTKVIYEYRITRMHKCKRTIVNEWKSKYKKNARPKLQMCRTTRVLKYLSTREEKFKTIWVKELINTIWQTDKLIGI